MNPHSSDDTHVGFNSDLPNLGAISLRALRGLDGAALHLVLDRVVQQTGRAIKSITTCSSAGRID
jgi:hypothetical protein